MTTHPLPRVVLVDDDPADQELFRIAMERVAPSRALVVKDTVEEALAMLRAAKDGPILVITDLKMPGRDGFDLLREVRSDERLRHLAVLMLTTSKASRDVESAHSHGCNAYHVKPLGLAGFEALLERILGYWGAETMLPLGGAW